jgi:hypothetical protein
MGERECAFEPDMMEIHCVECGKNTYQTGTCEDVNFCAGCRQDYIDSQTAVGYTVREAEISFITMIEGRGYKARYKPQRVLHLSRHGSPYCGIRGGPHPLTANVNETNCKRCIAKQVKGAN